MMFQVISVGCIHFFTLVLYLLLSVTAWRIYHVHCVTEDRLDSSHWLAVHLKSYIQGDERLHILPDSFFKERAEDWLSERYDKWSVLQSGSHSARYSHHYR